MAVTALEIKTRSPFAQGTAFGDVGPYEQLDGTVTSLSTRTIPAMPGSPT